MEAAAQGFGTGDPSKDTALPGPVESASVAAAAGPAHLGEGRRADGRRAAVRPRRVDQCRP
ncbi:hypothetical protein ACFWUW_31505 [Streptomyces sp. NPDC058655]|uniref:hypothetical protein n=1 Tax=Streptomyces sp. NPDC058655 TaxID=3346577 RepID=UPI0036530B42